MRVIAGKVGGLTLRAPRGDTSRPTSDRARETLFNVLAPAIPGRAVLDLFAGSGALGIEALSRGAASAVFVERDRRALEVLRENLERTRLAARAEVVAGDWRAALRRLGRQGRRFDLVLADPPWAAALGEACLRGLAEHDLLAPGARVVIEHRHGQALAGGDDWSVERELRVGDTAFALCRRVVPGSDPC